MKDEIKEILDNFKIYEDRYKKCNETQFIIFYRDIHLLLDYITNLQEQLHQASLDIQELTEKDIGCPSWCDKLTNLQEEKDKFKLRCFKALKLIRDNYGILDKYGIDMLDDILNGGDEEC